MSKDYRNPPDTGEGVWAWMFGDEPPLEVAPAQWSRRRSGLVETRVVQSPVRVRAQ